ncbi:alanine/glycine:cation symporter family protein [Anaerovorax sp. IOR16]|uniref:alanine/glycine:cation symporter family protein n=1 Tax=Anaerovorax sp. IOR16 TaxID=2773458 RepID=UPI0019D01144|nr:amino acid carrier protein [Anaerovorax sp. IOR16]
MYEMFAKLTGFLWGTPLLLAILVTGIFFTIRTKGFQFVHFGHIVTNMFKKDSRLGAGDDKNKLTPFQAISIAVGGSVGVSNMSGVATAISTGGPGALFWLWIAALFGMIIKMAEVTLAVYYRETNEDGSYRGGPTYYMQNGLGKEKGFKGWKLFSVIFGGGIFMTWFITIQNYTISEAVGGTFNIPYIWVSLAICVCVYVIIIGGIKKIGQITQYLVPIMCCFYIICALIIIFVNIEKLPTTISMIFKGAFTTQAASGGFLGATVAQVIRLGLARSVYSNEAGWGTSPMVHATANTDHPIKQGLMGAFEVFADTIVVCSMTGFVIIITGYWNSGLSGATLTAFESVIGSAARIAIAISIFLFGLTTSTGWFTYYRVILDHALKEKDKLKKALVNILILGTPLWGLLVVVLTVYGNGTPAQVWTFADFSSVIPTFVNVITLFLLGEKFIELLKDYKARYLGIGKVDPNFKLFYEEKLKK